MDNRGEVQQFLKSRRERLTPEQAGVLLHGGQRRVKGLRREEVAMLAAMSTDYYTRMERGNLAGVSTAVLESLAVALQFDEAERTHLFNLANASNTHGTAARTRRSPTRAVVREGVQRILDSITTPAYVRNHHGDLVATNSLARALFSDVLGAGESGFNMARYLFLDPRAREFFLEWESVARTSVAGLRAEAGRNPFDQGLTDLVGQLSTRSEEFRTWWATYNVKAHVTSTKTLHHSVAGDIQLTGEAVDLPGDPGLAMIIYTVEPGSASEQALAFLASWSTTNAPSAGSRTAPGLAI